MGTVPSAVVGLEVSYLDSSTLQVKWEPPLYPNGNITKYIISYQESSYSVWEQGIDWCSRQILSSQTQDNKDKNPDKNGKLVITELVNSHMRFCLKISSLYRKMQHYLQL